MLPTELIRSWIRPTLDIFDKYMPLSALPADENGSTPLFPPIYILTPKITEKTRARLITELDVAFAEPLQTSDILYGETLRGKNGEAILILQKAIPDLQDVPDADIRFQHWLWHELGGFYAVRAEGKEVRRCGELVAEDIIPPESALALKCEGYRLWFEFICESIACYVDEKHCSIDNAALYHPEQITWHPQQWKGLASDLNLKMKELFLQAGDCISYDILGTIYARLLTDDATKRFAEACREGILWDYKNPLEHLWDEIWSYLEDEDDFSDDDDQADNGFGLKNDQTCDSDDGDPQAAGSSKIINFPTPFDTTDLEQISLDPIGLDKFPKYIQTPMNEIHALLEEQMKQERFWEVSPKWLTRLGRAVTKLTKAKVRYNQKKGSWL